MKNAARTLAVVVAMIGVLGVGRPAAALSFGDLINWMKQVVENYTTQQYEYECGDSWSTLCHGDVPDDRPANPIPEPSGALIFGAGLLVAHQVARRRRRDPA